MHQRTLPWRRTADERAPGRARVRANGRATIHHRGTPANYNGAMATVTGTDQPTEASTDELTTGEAADLLGISAGRVRVFISEGRLPAHRCGPAWRVRRRDVEEFSRTGVLFKDGRGPRPSEAPSATWETLEVLAELGVASANELALAVNRHPGNVRKYLIILRHRGFAEGLANGDYEITDAGRDHLASTRHKEMRHAS